MKKYLSLFMAVVVVVTSMWVNVGTASAGSSNVSFYATDLTQADVKNAQMLVNSDYVDVYCSLQEDNFVVCNIPGKYAGENVQIYLGGQVFYVSVPDLKSGNSTSTNIETPVCEEEKQRIDDGDDCIEEPVCEEGQILVDGNCEEEIQEPVCEEGQILVDGNCEEEIQEPVCEEGQILVDGNCEEEPAGPTGPCFLRWTGTQWVHWWDGTPEYPGVCP